MSVSAPRLRIGGLDKLDARHFERELQDDVTFEQEELTTDKAGEPATLIIAFTLTALAIRAFAQWAMKERKRGIYRHSVEIEHPDGRRETRVVELDTRSSAPGSAEVIEKIGASLGLDKQLVAEAARTA
jgi:hypothetical protein